MAEINTQKRSELQIRAVGPEWESTSETGATNDGNFLAVLSEAKLPVVGRDAEKLVSFAKKNKIPPETAFALVQAANSHRVSPRNALEISARINGGEAAVDAVLGLSRRGLALGGKGATAPAVIVKQLSQIASVDAGFDRKDVDQLELLKKASDEKKIDIASKLSELQALSRDYAPYLISLDSIIELWEVRQDIPTVEHDLECVIASGTVRGERGVSRFSYLANLKKLIEAARDDNNIEAEEFFSEDREDPILDDEIDEALADRSWRRDNYLDNE